MELSTSVCRPCWRPQLAGIGLGVAIVLAFYVSGRGGGATGGATQIVTTLQDWILSQLTAGNSYLVPGRNCINTT
jgi:hypothetical protein